MHGNRCIGIVGCGNMGFALAHRLLLSGFPVVMGSRYPNKRISTQFEIVSIIECIRRSPIIFVAIRPEDQSCQQASFFRPGLACRLAWLCSGCLQARLKIKDWPAAWPGLACRRLQAKPG